MCECAKHDTQNNKKPKGEKKIKKSAKLQLETYWERTIKKLKTRERDREGEFENEMGRGQE